MPAHLEECSLIFLTFIIPLALYCLVLTALNRKRHAVLMPGPWDFAGVLFAASGFLLFGGPAILTGMYEQWRLSWLLGQARYLQGIGEDWHFWVRLWLGYFALVVVIAAVVLWRRRAQTSIYNVDPEVLINVLPQVMERLGLEWVPSGPSGLLLRYRPVPPNSHPQPKGPRSGSLVPGETSSDHPWSQLVVEPFPAMHHVTLHWRAHEPALRPQIEMELAKALAQIPTQPNSLAGWLLLISLGLFLSAFTMLFTLLSLYVSRILQLPR